MQPPNVRNLILQQLLTNLTSDYQNETYQFNTSLRNAIEVILTHQSDFNSHLDEAQKQEIIDELTLFMLAFIRAPSEWVRMLSNDEISAHSTHIVINGRETLTGIFRAVVRETDELVAEAKARTQGGGDEQMHQTRSKRPSFDFEAEYMNEATRNLMANLLNTVAMQICKLFQHGKAMLLAEAKKVQESIKQSKIMNPYFLFGILKQMSTYTYEQVEQQIAEYFKSLPGQTIRNFCHYVQKNYELVELALSAEEPRILTEAELSKHIQKENVYWLEFIQSFAQQELTLRRMESNEGEEAVMLAPKSKNKEQEQNEQSFDEAEKLIMKIGEGNRIMVTNAKATQKTWKMFDMKDSVSNFYKVMKQRLAEEAKDKAAQASIPFGMQMGQFANLGGNVGRCLADINKYQTANDFLKDLSKSTVIGGSITYILAQVPILSYFVIAGGLTYTFYHTLNNKATSNKKKFKQIGKTSITAVGSVGSAVAGMMIGQALIPIPFLGAFVGGMIGGFVGQTSASIMTSYMKKQSFKSLIKYLKNTMLDKNHWQYSQKIIQKLGISKGYFQAQILQSGSNRDTYTTGICFCIATAYENQRYLTRNQQKQKQLEQYSMQHPEFASKHEQHVEDEPFQNQFNIVNMVDYLTIRNFSLLREHRRLQKCICHCVA